MGRRKAELFASDQDLLNVLMYDLKGRLATPATILSFLKEFYPEDTPKRVRTRLKALTSPVNQVCIINNVEVRDAKRGRETRYQVFDKN